jgi:glucose dehydrogenase
MKPRSVASLAVTIVLALSVAAAAIAQSGTNNSAANSSKEWPTYGHDAGGMRFSPPTDITPANVSRLKVAWVYHMTVPPVAGASGRTGTAGPNAGAQVGETPEAATVGRGRGADATVLPRAK